MSGGMVDFSRFLGAADGLQKTTQWVMQRGIFEHFRVVLAFPTKISNLTTTFFVP
jgi:hypothetical protein